MDAAKRFFRVFHTTFQAVNDVPNSMSCAHNASNGADLP